MLWKVQGLWQGSDSPFPLLSAGPPHPCTQSPGGNTEKETKDEETAPAALLSELHAAKVCCPQCSSGFVREMTLARHHFLCACSIK